MAIFLGIDGGGSKTSCVVGDENSVLGSATAGASNVVRVGEAPAGEALNAAITKACGNAKVKPSAVQRTCIGVAGAARPEISSAVRRLLAQMVGGAIEVTGDMDIAFEAAFGSGPGVIVIAGTGSVAWGRNRAGQTARAGGWGYAVSDEGSGHWIGRTAVSQALRARDEGERSRLIDAILKQWELSSDEQLIVAANASPSPDFAALVPLVVNSAEAGDAPARLVLEHAGEELARLGAIVFKKLFKESQQASIAVGGGVLQHCAIVRQAFIDSLRRQHPEARVISTIADPLNGALEIARRGKK